MLKHLLLLMLLISSFTVQTAFAQREEANCGISAWVTDKDPNGTNVRDKPNVNGKVITKLKPRSSSEEDTITVYIVDYANGWVKIGRAEDNNGLLFEDLGWISAKMVETGTKGAVNYDSPSPMYAAAKTSSKKIGSIPSEAVVKISGYKCGWVKIIHKGKTGWIRGANICGNPFTTCS